MAGQGKIPASQIKEKFVRFLESFNAHDDQEAISQDADRALPSYVRMARDMDTSQGTTLYINFEHVNEYDPQLADAIITHHLEYDEALRQAVQTMVAKYAPEKLENGDRRPHEFFCSFYNLAGMPGPRCARCAHPDHTGVEPMRKLKTHYIGRLVSFAGTVTRTSEVRPELFSGTFKCLNCSTLKRNVPQQFRYTEPLLCGDPTCGNAYALQPSLRGYTYTPRAITGLLGSWQRMRAPLLTGKRRVSRRPPARYTAAYTHHHPFQRSIAHCHIVTSQLYEISAGAVGMPPSNPGCRAPQRHVRKGPPRRQGGVHWRRHRGA